MVVETQYFASPAIQSRKSKLDLHAGDAIFCVSTFMPLRMACR